MAWLDDPRLFETSEAPFPPETPVTPLTDPHQISVLRVLESTLELLSDPDPDIKTRPHLQQLARIADAIADDIKRGCLPVNKLFENTE